ncbi:hypothetical protein ABZ793_12020 [Micromonospora sp. NPDC047465]|uniref:hypothetical protein n=1 Tax=Micromonospora sp. NPDC047465 TaxID=3154813 RepID=UPI003405D0DF
MSRINRAQAAADLHAYADAITAGTANVPALRHVNDSSGNRIRVVPRAIHNVLCGWRVGTAQDTTPVVIGCAGCGLAYPREGGEPR